MNCLNPPLTGALLDSGVGIFIRQHSVAQNLCIAPNTQIINNKLAKLEQKSDTALSEHSGAL